MLPPIKTCRQCGAVIGDSGKEIAADAEAICKDCRAKLPAEPEPAGGPESRAASSKRSRAWAAAVLLVLVSAAGTGVYFWQEHQRAQAADMEAELRRRVISLHEAFWKEGSSGTMESDIDAASALFYKLTSGKPPAGPHLRHLFTATADFAEGQGFLEQSRELKAHGSDDWKVAQKQADGAFAHGEKELNAYENEAR